MKSLVNPKKSNGDKIVKKTYSKVVKELKIDPISEGLIMEKKVQSILIPSDLTTLDTKEKRDLATAKTDRIIDAYISRSKLFWWVYQNYSYNLGETKAIKSLSPWIKNPDKEIDRLNKEREEILKDERR